jgi:hypothetical protein
VTQQDLLTERYGSPSPLRRRLVVVGSVLLAAVFLAWLAWTAISHAEPEVRSELVTYEVIDEHTATAEISVVVRDDDVTGATCLLRAYAEDHSVVGEASFEPELGSGRYTQEIRTERRATSVERVGCTTPTQSRPR